MCHALPYLLEAIYIIAQDKGHARVRDICKLPGMKPSTVVEMVKKLAGHVYLVCKKNEGVYLIKEGEGIERVVLDRHNTIFAFLNFQRILLERIRNSTDLLMRLFGGRSELAGNIYMNGQFSSKKGILQCYRIPQN